MPNFNVRDAYGSVITIESSTIGGAERQVVSANISASNSSVMLLNGENVIGSVATLQSTNPWMILGSVSGTVGSSMIGMLPAGTRVIGSVAALQGTNPWNIAGSVLSISGNIASVVAQFYRNDALASTLGADLSYGPPTRDSAGRLVVKPYVADDTSAFRFSTTTTNGSVTLIQASAIGKRFYVTDISVANSGSVFTLLTVQDGSTSILAYVPVPATAGAIPQYTILPRTAPAQDLAFKVAPSVSILSITINGYQAP